MKIAREMLKAKSTKYSLLKALFQSKLILKVQTKYIPYYTVRKILN